MRVRLHLTVILFNLCCALCVSGVSHIVYGDGGRTEFFVAFSLAVKGLLQMKRKLQKMNVYGDPDSCLFCKPYFVPHKTAPSIGKSHTDSAELNLSFSTICVSARSCL